MKMIDLNKNSETYISFMFEDYLQDEFFIHSMNHPTKETEEFWLLLKERKLLIVNEYETARTYIESLATKDEILPEEEIDSLWEEILIEKIRIDDRRKNNKRIGLILFGVAASIAILLTSGVLFHQSSQSVLFTNDVFASLSEIEVTDDSKLIIGGDETVILEGKESKVIHGKEKVEINETTEKEVSESSASDISKLNRLVTPRGKRTILTLEDGTTIKVNSNTKIAYPSIFDTNKREIYVDGEVLLNVAKDPNRPFVVKTQQMDVTVLGTSFNVSAYSNDSVQSVILLTGMVQVSSKDEKMKKILEPNQMLSLSKKEYQVSTVNPDQFIAWASGTMICKNETLESITKKLSKYYGREIYLKESMKKIKCSGKLDLKDDFETILMGLTNIIPNMKIEKKNEEDYFIYN